MRSCHLVVRHAAWCELVGSEASVQLLMFASQRTQSISEKFRVFSVTSPYICRGTMGFQIQRRA
jgi:hypothetical protein